MLPWQPCQRWVVKRAVRVVECVRACLSVEFVYVLCMYVYACLRCVYVCVDVLSARICVCACVNVSTSSCVYPCTSLTPSTPAPVLSQALLEPLSRGGGGIEGLEREFGRMCAGAGDAFMEDMERRHGVLDKLDSVRAVQPPQARISPPRNSRFCRPALSRGRSISRFPFFPPPSSPSIQPLLHADLLIPQASPHLSPRLPLAPAAPSKSRQDHRTGQNLVIGRASGRLWPRMRGE